MLFVASVFFCKQKTAYAMRISDWSSDVCSSDLQHLFHPPVILDAWPSDDRRSRIIFITRNVGADALKAMLDAWAKPGVSVQRSEERRVGKECVSTCRSRWSPYH